MEERFDLLQFVEEGMNELLAISCYKNFTVHLRTELDDDPIWIHPIPVLVYEIRCRDLVYIRRERLYKLTRGDENNYSGNTMQLSFPSVITVASRAKNFFEEELMKKFLGEAEE